MSSITSIKKHNIIIITVTGKITIGDIFEHIEKNIEAWVGFPELWDFNEADLSEVVIDKWQQMSLKLHPLAEKKHGEKSALVSSSDLTFGMLRMFQSVSEGYKFPIKLESFRQIDDAKEWLSRK